EFFDKETGGYVVVDLRRIAHSKKSKNERKKFKDELEMAMVFAKGGHKIEMLDENSRKFKYDVKIDGAPADMKRIKTTNNIMRAASRAVVKQKARVVLFQFDKDELRVRLDLIKLKHKGYNVLYFFTDEQKVHIL
ncbi:MAG: hypothetical protein LUD72_12830, partial [Bacteroidales bacterium]|nr:hypothetical protein [Bacteroidales bacterium]